LECDVFTDFTLVIMCWKQCK